MKGFFEGIQNHLKIRDNSHISQLHSSANKFLWLRFGGGGWGVNFGPGIFGGFV